MTQVTGAVFEVGEGDRPILEVMRADLELLEIQVLGPGRDMAFTDLVGVQCSTHIVRDGEVVLAAPPAP